MLRLRLATLMFAAGLGLVAGCLNFPVLGRFRNRCAPPADCCEVGTPVCGDGPMLGDAGAVPVLPGGAGTVIPAPLAPQETAPQLAPVPRLVPQPQASAAPYVPGR
jgi:hypothetical protein